MAKDLPYFKFIISEWNDGDIRLCSMESQGLFINLCSLYWSAEGKLSLSKSKRRFSDCNAVAWKELISEGIIKINDDEIIINFLDEQFEERSSTSKTNSKNAKDGWNKRKNNGVAKRSHSDGTQVACNIEKKREEERRREEIKHAIFSDQRFMDDLKRNHKGKDYQKAFSECWSFHTQKGTVLQDWEWRQKLLTWLGNVKAEKQTVNPGKVQ